MLCFINNENFLLPLINMKRLRSKILSVLSQNITKHTITMCRCKFSNSNIKHTQRTTLVTEVTSEVWRRNEQVHVLRTEVSLQAVHSEDVTQQPNQEYARLHQHLTGLVQETQQSRDMLEESRADHSATGPEIERLRQREAELPREVRRHNNDGADHSEHYFLDQTKEGRGPDGISLPRFPP